MSPRYRAVAEKILPGWEISLAYVGAPEARRLNKKLRGKSYTPNVLAYQVGAKHGEVIICKEVAKREAAQYEHSYSAHTLFLFIHALLHLAGMRHGTTMERREQSLLTLYGSSHRHRNRHRDLSGQDRRRRRSPR